jgi:hypothetical protein
MDYGFDSETNDTRQRTPGGCSKGEKEKKQHHVNNNALLNASVLVHHNARKILPNQQPKSKQQK